MTARLVDVSKRFAGRWALARLNLEVPVGKSLLLTGANGAGKTTLLRVMATALKPTRGHLELFGLRAHKNLDEVRRRVGIVTHHNYLYDSLTALENLHVVMRLDGRRADGELSRVLDYVGLGPATHQAVGTFSAGMKRRLCIARLLLREPELALLDEPFGQLDPGGVALMEDIIRKLQRDGTTLVISTHDIERGEALCHLQLHLEGGRQVGHPRPIGS